MIIRKERTNMNKVRTDAWFAREIENAEPSMFRIAFAILSISNGTSCPFRLMTFALTSMLMRFLLPQARPKDLSQNNLHILLVFSSDRTAQKSLT
jgi:hypothetical protein